MAGPAFLRAKHLVRTIEFYTGTLGMSVWLNSRRLRFSGTRTC
jgi:hypothetical protein